MMNTSFNPLHLVNTYGAFGSITRERNEIVIEGTDDRRSRRQTVWREYEFKGKPGDPSRRPPQIAPYHLRLDWLMWFAAMSSTPEEHRGSARCSRSCSKAIADVLSLLRTNPFPDRPPRFVRAQYLLLSLHDARRARRQRADGGIGKLVGTYFAPVSLRATR